MNMILKKRLANRRGRRGFTLVEVIVVLVILAILAAIAIPALTGYIDKANKAEWEARMNTMRTAFQTELSMFFAEHGGIKEYRVAGSIGEAPNGEFFNKIDFYAPASGYSFQFLTTAGAVEYAKLTGDAQSFGKNEFLNNNGKWRNQFPIGFFDETGAIHGLWYIDRTYFDASKDFNTATEALHVLYIDDIDAADTAMVEWIFSGAGMGFVNDTGTASDPAAARAAGVTSGVNVFKAVYKPGSNNNIVQSLTKLY